MNDAIVANTATVLRGQTVFRGTRVLLETLLEIRHEGGKLDEFLRDYPAVERSQAEAAWSWSDEQIRVLVQRGVDYVDPTVVRLDLLNWSDALQRHINVPAYSLWLMACLAWEVESTIEPDAMTPELEAWLFRVEQLVISVVGVGTWEEAVRTLRISARSRGSLAAWLRRDEVPPRLREKLTEVLTDVSDSE